MQWLRVWSIPAVSVAAAALAGCGGIEQVKHPPAVSAAGTVTYNGSPVEGATVALVSEESKKSGWSCSGKTDSAGKFTISTVFAPGTDAQGVPAGDYTAVVTKYESGGGPTKEPKTKEEYAEIQKRSSPDPKTGKPPEPAAGPKSLVPVKYTAEKTSDLKIKVEAAGNSNIELKLAD